MKEIHMKEIGKTSRGYTVYVKDDEVGGQEYWCDHIDGGYMLLHTSLTDKEALAMAIDHWIDNE